MSEDQEYRSLNEAGIAIVRDGGLNDMVDSENAH